MKNQIKNLCLAGGVALNCVSNGKLLMNSGYENIWIQPAAGDAGSSLGAALNLWYNELGNSLIDKNNDDLQNGSRLGKAYSNEFIKEYLDYNSYPYQELNPNELSTQVAEILCNQKVVGWFNGRMEFGPRALGSRSILGDSRSPEMQNQMNFKIKYRESFRPFAPIVLEGHTHKWFNFNDRKIDESFESPYMLMVGNVNSSTLKNSDNYEHNPIDRLKNINSDIPAVTHVNGSARIQTVHKKQIQLYTNC